MIPVYNFFTFDKKSSRDFEVWISGSGTFISPKRDVTMVSVPGRNGDLTIDNGRFENVLIEYPAFIVKNFDQNYNAFKAYLSSKRGYKRLEDSYHPDYYRMALFSEALEPEMTALNRAGRFDVVFNCDPRIFLKTKDYEFTAAGSIKNPTLYDALPMIRAYGTGSFTIGATTVTISSANVYTDIDSEIQEAYKGDTNCNNNITLSNGEFPTLAPGINNISLSGISRLIINPRWWTV